VQSCSGIITSDPLFVDAASGNMRLQAASPGIDAGYNAALPVEVTTDLDARPRFVDVPGVLDVGIGTPPIVDIGPYEAHYESNLIIYVDQDAPGPIQDGSSWATAYAGLQNGLAVAVEGDQIWVAEGVYYPGSPGAARTVTFQLKNGVALYGGFAGMEASLNERDWATHPTILSGDLNRNGFPDDDNAYHVVSGSSLDSSAVLDGLTIAAGNANGADPLNRGGGIYMPDSSPTLQNLVIRRNYATWGGGMYGYGAPYLANVTFLENHSNGEGGGLYILSGNATIQNALFHFNTTELKLSTPPSTATMQALPAVLSTMTKAALYSPTALCGGTQKRFLEPI
jgi:hypothetical protein